MPSLRILTWNSTGENATKVLDLTNEAAFYAGHGTNPEIDVFLIQEARQGPGGAIRNYLTGLSNYTIHHIPENLGGGGKGYICATRNASVTVTRALQLWNYAADPGFMAWTSHTALNASSWTPPARTPAYTLLRVGATNILLITWHAPRGISMLPIIVGSMTGGALLDAYMALDQSGLLNNPLLAVNVVPHFIVIAGDMNAKSGALGKNYHGYTPLVGFEGVSNNLDCIMAKSPAHTYFNFTEQRSVGTTSDHAIFCALMNW